MLSLQKINMIIQPSVQTAAEWPWKSVFVTEIFHYSSFLFHKLLHKLHIFTVEIEKFIVTGFWVELIVQVTIQCHKKIHSSKKKIKTSLYSRHYPPKRVTRAGAPRLSAWTAQLQTPKLYRSGGELLATLCPIWPAEPQTSQTSRSDSNIVATELTGQ